MTEIPCPVQTLAEFISDPALRIVCASSTT